MSFILVTGISGAGKSTARKELIHRGYEVHGIDEDGIARWVNKLTGAVTGRVDASARSPGFTQGNDWMVDPECVRQLAQSAQDRPVFLCGAVANEIEVWNLFNTVVLLSIDEATMRDRVAQRTTNDFGKNPHELELMLKWRRTIDDDYRRYGAVIIDAMRPVAEVVDEIVQELPIQAPH
jgi:adenylate kinase family enzyme